MIIMIRAIEQSYFAYSLTTVIVAAIGQAEPIPVLVAPISGAWHCIPIASTFSLFLSLLVLH